MNLLKDITTKHDVGGDKDKCLTTSHNLSTDPSAKSKQKQVCRIASFICVHVKF